MKKLRVLIVDDSVVFRSQIKAALLESPAVEIAGAANNGKIALEKLAQTSVDLVTLDMEMPEMGGLETLRAIRKAKYPVRVIVFSAYTTRGSEATLDALAAGADDFVAKPSGSDVPGGSPAEWIRAQLLPKVLQFVDPQVKSLEPSEAPAISPAPAPKRSGYAKRDLDTFLPQAIVIGSSTGGPPALERCLVGIPKSPKVPIFVAQHMPPVFTASLAKRLEESTGISAAEGKDGETVHAGRIYVAPGNFHMTLKKVGSDVKIQLDQGPLRNSVRPAVDNLFESAVRVYGAKCMGVVLTGMGEDGRIGCRAIKEAGGGVLIQDKASSVVFGMPGAIFDDGTYDGIGDTNKIMQILKRMTA